MANDRITVKIFNPKRTSNRICNNPKVGLFLANTWIKYFAKYTPMQTGTLRESVTPEPFRVTYNAPYAHYQWQGELYVSPSTGSAWAKPGEIKVPTGIPLEYDKEQNPLATDHWEVSAEQAFKKSVARQVTEYIRRM